MPFKFIGNVWHTSLNLYKFEFYSHSTKLGTSVFRQANLLDIFNKNRGSWVEGLDLWTNVWKSYSFYYRFTRFSNLYQWKYINYMSQQDFKRFELIIRDFQKQIHFLQNQLTDLTSYRLNEESYRNIECIINYIQKYNINDIWISLPGYEKPIKTKANKVDPTSIFKNIELRHIDLDKVKRENWIRQNQQLFANYLNYSNPQPRRRGRPPKTRYYQTSLYGY